MRGNRFMGRLLRDRRGTSAVEYGIILGFIVIGLFVAVGGVASETLKMWTHVGAETAKAQNSN
jgi:pilus assembly protein Flp/PilA